MANEEHLDILRQGVEVWNNWNSKHYKIKPDLSGANLTQADLSGIILSDTDLSDADLSEARLVNATLVRTNFTRATLIKAELDGADFHQAILWQANLRNAFLVGALFNYTDLEEANFSHATVELTIFGDVDLRNVKGLKSIRHRGNLWWSQKSRQFLVENKTKHNHSRIFVLSACIDLRWRLIVQRLMQTLMIVKREVRSQIVHCVCHALVIFDVHLLIFDTAP